jgi:hypothetical protein
MVNEINLREKKILIISHLFSLLIGFLIGVTFSLTIVLIFKYL